MQLEEFERFDELLLHRQCPLTLKANNGEAEGRVHIRGSLELACGFHAFVQRRVIDSAAPEFVDAMSENETGKERFCCSIGFELDDAEW